MKFLLKALGRLFLKPNLDNIKSQMDALTADSGTGDHDRLPDILIAALIHGEDHRFYKHEGVDFFALARCIKKFIFERTIEGGSTIEQQLIRTLIQKYERTFARKIREISLSLCVSENYQKRDLAAAYLKIAYFGWRMNGISQACHRLKIDINKISADEACLIIAALKYPLPRSPSGERMTKINRRKNHILQKLGTINESRQ